MHRGYSHFQTSALSRFWLYKVAKASSVVAVGLVLSGCVATALTPSVSAPSPVLTSNLSLTPQDTQDPNAVPDALPDADGTTTTDDQTTPVLATSGITVPVRRPGSPTPSQQQLALTNTNTTSVAAQKAEKVAQSGAETNSATGIKTNNPINDTATSPTANPVSAPLAPPKKKANIGFFASLFQTSTIKRPKRPKRSVIGTKHTATKNNRKVAVFKPVTKGALPGVRKLGLFGIYDSTEGANEGYDDAVRLASIGGLARTSPNGLRIQHSRVQVACLQPGLVRIIKQVQRRYGRVPVVTSGYRNPARNRSAGGARNSMHIYCKAADIQVTGVSKWALAKYLRSIPGRGGVGTYCHTKSVHVDVGSKRDWNWRCKRGKRSKKRRSRRKRKG